MLAIYKAQRRRFRLAASPGEELVVGGQPAGGVGARGVTGQRKGLTAAAAPIDLAPLAGATRFRHPGRPAEPLEGGGTIPDFREARLRDAGEIQSFQCLRRMAR